MKTVFQAYARYNKNVNQDIIDIVKNLPQETLMQEFKTYYPTVYDTLVHILLADIFYLKRFKTLFGEYGGLKNSTMVSYDKTRLEEELKPDYTRLFALLKTADEEIAAFVGTLQDDDYTKVVHYKNFKGDAAEMEVWQGLMQMFNHGTHHRGLISALLDMLGIDNDYSAVLPRI